MKVASKGHHALFRTKTKHTVGEQEYDSHGGISGKGVKQAHRGGVHAGNEYTMHDKSFAQREIHGASEGAPGSHQHHGPSGATMHEREQLSNPGRKQIHEERHMALANTTDGHLTAPATRDANFGQREYHNGRADLKGAVGDKSSFHYEGKEFGDADLHDNLGSERKKGYGQPQGGTTTLADRGSNKGIEHVHGLATQGPSGLPAHEHGAAEYHAGARNTAGPHPMTTHLEDETRGTHGLAAHEHAAKRHIPQEAKEALARVLVRHRGR
jgi:hypothetical protein